MSKASWRDAAGSPQQNRLLDSVDVNMIGLWPLTGAAERMVLGGEGGQSGALPCRLSLLCTQIFPRVGQSREMEGHSRPGSGLCPCPCVAAWESAIEVVYACLRLTAEC